MNAKVVCCLLLGCGISWSGGAELVTIPLNCTGAYTDGQAWSTELDLSEQFLSIDGISIQWSGAVTIETYFILGEDPTLPSTWLPGAFFADMVTSGSYHSIGGAMSDQTPGWPFDLFEPPLIAFSGTDAFGFSSANEHLLLEGPVTLTLRPGGVGILPAVYSTCNPADGVLYSAALLVEGQPVPEPATLALLTLGGLLVRRSRGVKP